MSDVIIKSAEECLDHLDNNQPVGNTFQLAISDAFTFRNQPDEVGFGMAIVVDKILGLDYEPDGFIQKDGYRVYKYKRME